MRDRDARSSRPSMARIPSSPDTTRNMTALGREPPPSASRASVPPSEPRPSRTSFSSLDAAADRPARLQMVVALMLGLVLVAIPLYLWRRPRAESIAVARASADAGPLSGAFEPGGEGEPASSITLSDPRVLACQDPGPKKTPPSKCDHLVEVETALAKAIDDSLSCVPSDTSGTIQYVADVSFKRKTIGVLVPRDGRTIKSSKVASACASAVKSKLHSVPLERMAHEHARYKISITATYPAAPKP